MRSKPTGALPYFVPRSISAVKGFSLVDKAVYGALYCLQGSRDEVEADYSLLARGLNLDRRSVAASIRKLSSTVIAQIRAPRRDFPGLFEVRAATLRNQRKMFAEMRSRQEKQPKVQRIRAVKTG